MSEEEIIDTSYDEVLYDSLPHTQGNIRFIETVADLFQIGGKDINECRVLEIGTATGKTIIPQAEELPNSQFLGIDLSGLQIEAGQHLIRSLGLKNIELRHANMMDVDSSWGKFDYIIAHGVYSWIPEIVQEKMLQICETNLSSNGIAMISYNTYPGWHFKEFTRNLMMLHSRQANTFPDPETQIQQARAIVNYATQRMKNQDSYFAKYLKEMQEHVQGIDDYYLFHEYLESENRPCYFLEFCRRLREKKLAYVSDFEWTDFQVWLMDAELSRLMEKTHHLEISEQYMDFLINRTFRSTILCREGVRPQLRTDLVNRYSFYIPNDCEIKESEDKGKWVFKRRTTLEISLGKQKLVDLLVDILNQSRSEYMTAQSVWEKVVVQGGPHILSGGCSRSDMEKVLDQLIKYGILKIILHPPIATGRDPRRPYARAFQRQMVKRNANKLSNSTFEILQLDALASLIIKQLDGRHSFSDIVAEVQKEVRNGKLTIAIQGKAVRADQRDQITSLIDTAMKNLQNCRFFVC